MKKLLIELDESIDKLSPLDKLLKWSAAVEQGREVVGMRQQDTYEYAMGEIGPVVFYAVISEVK